MSVGIRASTNKFAFLHVQDSSDDTDSHEEGTRVGEKPKAKGAAVSKKTNNAPNNSGSANAKKKTRRRKKKNSSTSSDAAGDGGHGAGNQMQDWVQHDQNFVNNLYDDDLRKAIEISKVEFEKEQAERSYFVQSMNIDIPRQVAQQNEVIGSPVSKSTSPPKKERKKIKTTKTISLEKFHQHVESSLPLKDDEELATQTGQNKGAPSPEEKSNFFEDVEKAASYITRNEQAIRMLHAEHEKKKTEKSKPGKINKRDQRQQAEEEKDQIIEKLRREVVEWEHQFKHVKKRNKQLLVMLQQGEMKDKSELLLEIERLSILRDELTQEVSNMNESLEQERSRSRKLKDEVAKLQAKKSHDDPSHSK